jgi:UPF0755 protein
MSYTTRPTKKRWPKRLVIVGVILTVAVVGGLVAARQFYFEGIKPVSAGSQAVKTIEIKSGATLELITVQLKDAGLIRNTWAFKLFVARKKAQSTLQAGTYTFSPSQSVEELVAQLSHGKVATDLVAIIPGQTLDQIRTTFINYGFSEDAIDAALDPSLYASSPALSEKPAGANLEGYIYPDSYQKTSSTTVQQIITKALAEMGEKLTPALRKGFEKQGLTTHEAIILASIVEREVPHPVDRAQVAQVFLKRLRSDIALESNATEHYFNSYRNPGLPPTPISNVSVSSLEAVANPASTSWLYFVSGDDKVTHFSKTLAEHETKVRLYCTKLCR